MFGYCRNERYASVCSSPHAISTSRRVKWVWPEEPLQTTESIHYRLITTALCRYSQQVKSRELLSRNFSMNRMRQKKKTNIKTSFRITNCLSGLRRTSVEFKNSFRMKEFVRSSGQQWLSSGSWRVSLREELIRLILILSLNLCEMVTWCRDAESDTASFRISNTFISNARKTGGLVVIIVLCASASKTLLQTFGSLHIQFIISSP
jgi:hypothetical protein